MKQTTSTIILATLGATAMAVAAPPLEPEWQVVVNNGFEIPDNEGRFYNSYNPPSVNSDRLVVFRARSTGRQQGPVSGIYTRDMATPGSPIDKVADRDTEVPPPNNTAYPVPGQPGEETLATFNEFPAFPRIAITADSVATRGNHPPVWTYEVDEGDEVTETRAGTTGVYVNLDAANPGSPLVTGASLLGAVPKAGGLPGELEFPEFRVPGIEPATKFDVFPGSPAITDAGIIAFKGNYTVEAIGKTGVFYRPITAEDAGGPSAIALAASSDTAIPNPGDCEPGTLFGSTAPPSAADGHMVFVGFDDEGDPTCGGLYMAPLAATTEPPVTLVGLDTRVPGQASRTFGRLGEGLSYDGRLVGFWGAWGDATRTVRLYCPEEGNRARRDYCNHTGDFAPDPDTGEIRGDPNSECDDTSDPRYPELCYQERQVPIHQGIFVYDTDAPVGGRLSMLARTGPGAKFDDFVYWNYSGAPPGVGEGEADAEPPRFRSSAFLAVSASPLPPDIRVAFLGRRGDLDPATNTYDDPLDGIYLATGPGQGTITTLIQTGMAGTILDEEAVWDDDEDPTTPDVPLPIATLALERDAFRGNWLAISASMGVEEAGWAGIYLANLCRPPHCR